MKLTVAAIIALFTLNANAAVLKKQEIKILPAGALSILDAGDSYGTALAVGRISPFSMQVELVGFTVPDVYDLVPPIRLVKAVLDISSTDPGDTDANDLASERLDFFFSTKIGKQREDGSSVDTPIAKIVTVVYDPTDVIVSTKNCLGLDLEVANIVTPATKECYVVRPKYIIKHNL